MTNLKNDENNTFHQIQKQDLVLLPETHTIYYKELHTAVGLRNFYQKLKFTYDPVDWNLFQGCPDWDKKFSTQFFTKALNWTHKGSTIKFNNLLNKDEAELIGPGIQIYLDGLQTFGTIQVWCALSNVLSLCFIFRNMESKELKLLMNISRWLIH